MHLQRVVLSAVCLVWTLGCIGPLAVLALPPMGEQAKSAPPRRCRQPPPGMFHRAPQPNESVPGRVVQREQDWVFVGQVVNGQREGPGELFGLNAEGRYEVGSFHAGKKTGVWDEWFQGYLSARVTYVDGVRRGLSVAFDRCGNEAGRTEWDDQQVNGLVVRYHDNGVKRSEETQDHGVRSGPRVEWYDNGELALRATYQNGQPVGLWEEFHNNGMHSLEKHYGPGGLVVGAYREWFRDGSPKVDKSFDTGAANVEYWNNGKKKSERGPTGTRTFYATGDKETETVGARDGKGALKQAWYMNGQLMLRVQYDTQGNAVSLERWDPDGSVVTADEWARREATQKEIWAAVAKVLEIPLTIVLSGLK